MLHDELSERLPDTMLRAVLGDLVEMVVGKIEFISHRTGIRSQTLPRSYSFWDPCQLHILL
jgi:hypothetical protein